MYRILLVDDEKYVLKSLKASVDWETYGFEVAGMALSAEEALEFVEEIKPDVVFTDIRMPGICGLELLQMIRKICPDIICMIISGYAEFAYVQKALQLEAVGYCLKPFDYDEITGYLKRIKEKLDAQRGEEESRISNQTFLAMKEYVEQNFREHITIVELGEKFHINSCYVSRLFKKELGRTLTEFLTECRIANACELLRNSSASINEIAELSGFSDYFYFARVFRKVMNSAPGEYRLKHRKEEF